MNNTMRNCLQCGKTVRGRLDKKFCDDYCRNAYNNRQNADTNNYVRNVNNALRRNRRILSTFIKPEVESGKCPRQKLAEQGFDFRYHTHQYFNKKGQAYNFCYDFGYLGLEGDWVLVVRGDEGDE